MFNVLGSRAALAVVLAAVLFGGAVASATPLDDYVAAPDSAYSWELHATYPHTGYTDYILSMNSQVWSPPGGVNVSLWHHWMVVTVPDQVDHETGMLFIGGGSIYSSAPTQNEAFLVNMATQTHTVVAQLKQIPNEPLTFTGYRQETEDGLIAYGWKQFLLNGDPMWLMRLPMTKGAVRAMDTLTAFMASPTGGARTLDKFVVSGASKRGWTTWTTGAVDAVTQHRVVGIAPVVIDVLNMSKSMRHHFDAYGFYAPSVDNYTENGIMDWLDTPQLDALCSIVEPYWYRDRLTMPKYVMSASQDEFFLPDSSQFYFGRLKGEKRLQYIPNVSHGVEGPSFGLKEEACEGLTGWYSAIVNNVPRPEVTWYKRHDGSLVIDTHGNTPTEALLWTATNANHRMFIKEVFGPLYQSSTLEPASPGRYVAAVAPPAQGWSAFYAMFKFDSGSAYPFVFTTEVSVVPDVLPYGPQYSLSAATPVLDEAFYTQGGPAPVLQAAGTPSNSGEKIALWGANFETSKAGLFVVDLGNPSGWQRLTSDISIGSHYSPILWAPDDSAILVNYTGRVEIPQAGQPAIVEPFSDQGTNGWDRVLAVTGKPMNNYTVGRINGNLVLFPILPDGHDDTSRQPVVVANFEAAGIATDHVAISGNGTVLAFVSAGDVYTLHGVDAIVAAPPVEGTNISSLAPASLDAENVFRIRTSESDNFAGFPSLSQDGSLVYFLEDWNNAYNTANAFNLSETDFDIMVSYSDGTEADARLTAPGTQSLATITRCGMRAVYSELVDGMARLFAASVPVTTASWSGPMPGYGTSPMDSLRTFDSDGTATLNLPAGVSANFPSGTRVISIKTPVSPGSPDRFPSGVTAISFVRVLGPEDVTFNGNATLVLKYNDAQTAGLNEDALNVYRLNPGTDFYEPVLSFGTSRNAQANTIAIEVDRLGTYALGVAASADSDSDGMPDDWETEHGLNPNANDAGDDPDTDGLLNLEEFWHHTDPQNADSDGDGLSDGDETRDLDRATPGVQNPFSPVVADSTGNNGSTGPDGIPDGENDWDGDGQSNALEFANYSNPIDPTSTFDADGDGLVWSTFLGGNNPNDPVGAQEDCITDVFVDAQGQLYVAGYVVSPDFPTTAGAYKTGFQGFLQGFVSKFDRDGKTLLYSTFIGGSTVDAVGGIAVRPDGGVVMLGITMSPDFPLVNSNIGGYRGNVDNFVARLAPNGGSLVFSTCLGGTSDEQAVAGNLVALDGEQNIYVTATTRSWDFPVTPGAFRTAYRGDRDVAVCKIAAGGESLVYSTFLNGGYREYAYSIGVTETGEASVAGYTGSYDFPVTEGVLKGQYDGFVSRLNATGSVLLHSVLVGGSDSDQVRAQELASDGSIWLCGYTRSADFPTTPGAIQPALASWQDAFVAQMHIYGTYEAGYVSTIDMTLIGGTNDETALGLTLAPDGVWVVGQTASEDFPTSPLAYDRSFNGGNTDAFAALLPTSLNALTYGTYLGGSAGETSIVVAQYPDGSPVIAGNTGSIDYPTTSGAFDTSLGGNYDGFMSRLNIHRPDTDGDGMPDAWETAHGLDPNANDAADDPDGDGLANIDEMQEGTDPQNADTDSDGLTDSQETMDFDPETPGVQNPFDPTRSDVTGSCGQTGPDGWADGENDWDCDGVSNRQELEDGTNPLDSGSHATHTTPAYILGTPTRLVAGQPGQFFAHLKWSNALYEAGSCYQLAYVEQSDDAYFRMPADGSAEPVRVPVPMSPLTDEYKSIWDYTWAYGDQAWWRSDLTGQYYLSSIPSLTEQRLEDGATTQTFYDGQGTVYFPELSPLGPLAARYMAYVRFNSSYGWFENNITAVPADPDGTLSSSAPRILVTNFPSSAQRIPMGVRWASDAERITFQTVAQNLNFASGIYVLNGTDAVLRGQAPAPASYDDPRVAVLDPNAFGYFPSFGPDGKTVFYCKDAANIFRSALDLNANFVSSQFDITYGSNAGGAAYRIPMFGNQIYASVSPDGTKVAFVDNSSGTWDIYIAALLPIVDADHDCLSDDEEAAAGTDPNNLDSDGDGLTDYEEVRLYATNPLQPDTDSDGFSDGDEVREGSNPLDSGSYPQAVMFADAALENAVRDALNEGGGIVTTGDMLRLTSLSASYQGISNLSGLEYATNLQYLGLAGNQVVEMSPLAAIANLYTLDLSTNHIQDAASLAAVTSLQSLYLSNNEIQNVAPLAGLTNIQVLDLSVNRIVDISPLRAAAGLYSGDVVYLFQNPLGTQALCTDIPAFAGIGVGVHTNLYCGGDYDGDTILDGLEGDWGLDAYTQDTDGDGASDFTEVNYDGDPSTYNPYDPVNNPGGTDLNATAVDTDGDGFGDNIEILLGNDPRDPGSVPPYVVVSFADANLEWVVRSTLNKPSGDITNIDMMFLTDLYASWWWSISDLTGLEYAINLRNLQLNGNSISDLGPLSGLVTLENLQLSNNQVADLGPLAALTSLSTLTLDFNQVADLAPLAAITNLYTLQMNYNQIEDVGPLAGMQYLNNLSLSGNRIRDIGALTANTGLGAGDSIYLHTNPLGTAALCTDVPALQARGAYVGTEFSCGGDFDGDGLLDGTENDWGLSATQSDSDGDGLTDYTEANHDGDPTTYNPYDPATNPGGTDLNARQADTDGDGYNDALEVHFGSNPVDPCAVPMGVPVTFADAQLESAIRSTLNKPAGDVTSVDLFALTSFNANYYGIVNLSGLEYAVNLQWLNLGNNQIVDLTPLSGLGSLYYVDLAYNRIGNLAPLAGNAGLGSGDQLYVQGNPLTTQALCSDIPTLQGRNVYVYASLSCGGDADGDGLLDGTEGDWGLNATAPDTDGDGLTDYAEANTDGNPTTYNPYDPATNPSGTDTNAALADTDGDGYADGAEAHLGGNPLDPTVFPVSTPVSIPDPALESILRGALYKPVGDITDVDLYSLTSLQASYAGIVNLTGLEYASSLQSLNLSGNQVSDLSPLAGLPALVALELNYNPIRDLTPLLANPGLAAGDQVWLYGTRLRSQALCSDIPALQGRGVGVYTDLFCGGDLDGDGILDGTEGDWGLNAYTVDTDFDGLSDYAEVAQDGDPYTYNPYDPVNNPGGTDLNASAADTDGDGYRDDVELHFGANPLDPAGYPAGTPIAFADPNLEGLVRSAVGKPSGDITDVDMFPLASLSSWYGGITNLSGLEYAVNLQWLTLYANQISDLTPLAGLTSLTSLDLQYNRISDLTPLVANPGLAVGDGVNLYGNPLGTQALCTDILALQSRGVGVYTDLSCGGDLDGDGILDGSEGDWGLSAWQTDTDGDGLTDYAEAARDGDPWTYNPYHPINNPIGADLNASAADTDGDGYGDGVEVHFGANPLDPAAIPVGTPVVIADPQLELALRDATGKPSGDLTDVDMYGLTSFEAGGRGIMSLSGLEYAVRLRQVGLYGNQISDLSPLAGLTSLASINLHNNRVRDLTPLVGNPGLGSGDTVYLYGNPLTSNSLCSDLPALASRGVGVYTELTCGGDYDGDTLSDGQEGDWGLNPYGWDTDGDGLSDYAEAGYDGDPATYNPYHPVSNPSGTDLDAASADTDGDGCRDDVELHFGGNALDPASYPTGTPVTFADPNLELAIRLAINKPSGDVTSVDMYPISTLYAYGMNISNLSGLEYAVNLQSLELQDNRIEDLTPLAGLTELHWVYLWNNRLTDIAPLVANSALGSGDYIYLGANPLGTAALCTDIPALQSRGAYVDVNLSCAGDYDGDGLFDGTEGDWGLNAYNRDTDGDTLSDYAEAAHDGDPATYNPYDPVNNPGGTDTSATSADTDGDGFRDDAEAHFGANPLDPASSPTATPISIPDANLLAVLRSAVGKPDGDITDVDLFTLGYLYAGDAGITDLSGLEYAVNLRQLHLGNNQVSDLTPLAGLTELQTVYLWQNRLSGIAPLVANTGIGGGDVVYLDNNPLGTAALCSEIPALLSRGVYVGALLSCWGDYDHDGLPDGTEGDWGLNAHTGDTDNDGLSDYDEVSQDGDPATYNPYDPVNNPTGTDLNATNSDSDGDSMADGWEVQHGLSAFIDDASGDLDGDGLTNLQEYQVHSNPNAVDSDADGLTDAEEVLTFGTNPAAADTDDDGLTDYQETTDLDPAADGVQNPFVPWDADALGDNGQPWGDGRRDGWNDWDGDGVSNRQEWVDGTNPIDAESVLVHAVDTYLLGTPTRIVSGAQDQFFAHLKWSHSIYAGDTSYQLAYLDVPHQQFFRVASDGTEGPTPVPMPVTPVAQFYPYVSDFTWAYGDGSWWRSELAGQPGSTSIPSLIEQRVDTGQSVQTFFDGRGTVYFPDLSPEGPLGQRYMGYVRYNTSIGNIEQNITAVPVEADGQLLSGAPRIALTNLPLSGNHLPTAMRWSTDAERIAVQYVRSTGSLELPVSGLYVLQGTGAILRGEAPAPTSLSDGRLVGIDTGAVGYPSFAADGGAVFYTKDTTQTYSGALVAGGPFETAEFDIAYASSDGGAVRAIAMPGDQIFACVSPDGTKIAYADNSSGAWDIYVADLVVFVDSDHDGISDAEEVSLGTDPNDADSDDDGLSDNDEVRDLDPATPDRQNPFNPLDPDSTGNNGAVGPDGVLDGANDWDNDGISNAAEFAAGTDPLTSDNRPPVLAPIGNQVVNEGQTLTIAVSASDPDGTIPALHTPELPGGAGFVDNGDGTGAFTWTPGHDAAAGSPYSVTFTTTDGVLAVSETVEIVVCNVPNPPNAPVVNGTTPTDDTTPTWTWVSGGNGGAGVYRYRLDSSDGAWTAASETAFTPTTALSGGLHELEVQEQSAVDPNDWSVSGRFTIVVESIPGASRVWGCTFGAHSEIFQVDTATGALVAYHDFGNMNFIDVAVDPSESYLYAVHVSTGYPQLSKIDTATLTVRQTWPLPSEVSINALAWKGGTGDTLLGVQDGGTSYSLLYEITLTSTGPSVRTVGQIPAGGSDGDLAEDPATGQWWATFTEDDASVLMALDTLNPEASVAGPDLGSYAGGTGRVYVDALEYDGNGTLWGASSETNAGATYGTREVYRVQISGGNATVTPVCDLGAALQGDGITGLARSQSLVLNGGFETGTNPGNYTKLSTGSTAITNWSVLPNGAYYIGPYYQAAGGTRSVKLTTHVTGAVAQTLKTVPGRSYMLTFSMAGDPYQNLTPAQKVKELTVTVAGRSEDFRFDVTGRSVSNMGWETRSWRFTATAAETQLKFATKTPAPYGPCVDNVAVVPIQGEVLWGVTNGLGDGGFGSGGQIFTFDTATGAVEVKASYGAPVQAFGDIAVRDTGDIYVTYQDSADGFDKLARVNPATWAFDWTQDLGGAAPDVNGVGQVNALEFIDGKLLGVTAGPTANLLQFKPNGSGALVSNLGNLGAYSEGDLAQNLVGTVSYTDRAGSYSSLETLLFGPPLSLSGRVLDFAQVGGLAYDRYGVLWAARSVDQALYTVNQCYPALTPAFDLSTSLGGAIEGLSRPGFYEQTVDLLNGSFEQGTDPLAATKLPAGSTALSGWTVGGYGVYYVGTYYQAGEGTRCIKLTQQRPGWIQQTFETEVGQTYEVNFKMAGDPYPYLTPEQKVKVAEVSAWDGTVLVTSQQFSFDTTGRNVSNMGWADRTWRFTATSTQTTLRFTSISAGPYGPCVDDVTIRKAD